MIVETENKAAVNKGISYLLNIKLLLSLQEKMSLLIGHLKAHFKIYF